MTRTVTSSILWAIAVLGLMALAGYAGYYAMHTTGRTQSGWDMCLCIVGFLFVMVLDLNDYRGGNWLPKVLGVLAILLAVIFGVHYFAGEAGLKALLEW